MEIVLTLENANAVLATRTVLLVDDEENILSALKRLLQRDGYRILTAGGGLEGLAMLASEPVDVIISDRRIPQMAGVEFLRHVKPLYPDTVHMVLSGYTELQSITNDINEGAIYRFLTKPWDDDLLAAVKRHQSEKTQHEEYQRNADNGVEVGRFFTRHAFQKFIAKVNE